MSKSKTITTEKMLDWLAEQEQKLMTPVLEYHFENKKIIDAIRALILEHEKLKKAVEWWKMKAKSELDAGVLEGIFGAGPMLDILREIRDFGGGK